MAIHLTSCHYAERPLATASEFLELARRLERGDFGKPEDAHRWAAKPVHISFNTRNSAICIDALRRTARA